MPFDTLPQMSLFFQNAPVIANPPEERTLFLGDLSVYCTEEDLGNFFRPFGTIEKIRMKHATNNKNLSYGFITFSTREAAERVIQQMNGKVFLGRTLRLGWAAHKDKTSIPQYPKQEEITSAQIHVSFLSKQVRTPRFSFHFSVF
jgi:heterogeneous nuclear ribonucleoprotein R